jgi:hypothetical protein
MAFRLRAPNIGLAIVNDAANARGQRQPSPGKSAFLVERRWLVALLFACVNLLFYAILAWTSSKPPHCLAPEGSQGPRR